MVVDGGSSGSATKPNTANKHLPSKPATWAVIAHGAAADVTELASWA